MPHSLSCDVALACHTQSPPGPLQRVGARLSRHGSALSVCYDLEGDLRHVLVPAPRSPRIVSGLWHHTCCEIFIRLKGLSAYHEFNLAPSGEWAAFAFTRYREGALLADGQLDPHVRLSAASENRLELEAVVDLRPLSPQHAGATLLLGLSAVIETEDRSLSYWALAHPPGRPDFHHPDTFVLELAPDPAECSPRGDR